MTPEAAAPLLVVTDLDGSLLDATYSAAAAEPALRALRDRGIPLVLCSSKTRAEVAPISRALGLSHPFIVENGGAIVFPRARGDNEVLLLGIPRAQLTRALQELARRTECRVRGFADFTSWGLSRLTGLDGPSAERALDREFDEPFLVESGDVDRLARVAEAGGLRVTRGGRFFHLTGPHDKATGLRALLERYERQGMRFSTVGLGDSQGDLPLLRAVDWPIVIPGPEGDALANALPGAERAPAAGPSGWNAAVLAVLEGASLPLR